MINAFGLLLVMTHSVGTFFEVCSENWCPPLWNRANTVSVEESNSVFIGRDAVSGCTCREFPEKFSFCFGRDTCRSFPRNLNFSTQEFALKASQIVEISPEDLTMFTHLRSLHIEGNYNLTRISPRSFRDMQNLKNLSISYNVNLKYLEMGCFEGLTNLERLYLVKNGFSELSNVTGALINLPKLFKLDLSKNSFSVIKNNDFLLLKNTSLRELNLILCQIEIIEPNAFLELNYLTALRLGENGLNISSLGRSLEKMNNCVSLKFLNLYAVGLRTKTSKELLKTIAKSNITTLILARNQFEIISSEMFPKMPNIQILDLREVLALNITNNAFVNLPNLRTLLLSENKLTSIPSGVLLEQLNYLDLQKNSGVSSYFSTHGQQFIKMKSLRRLNLSFNAIHALYNSSFRGLDNLEVLGLKNATIYSIAQDTFSALSQLVFLNLENNHFVQYDRKTFDEGLFRGLYQLRILLLGGCSISFLTEESKPFKSLNKLEHLGLEKNKLFSLPNFYILPNLRSLDLSANNLQLWHAAIFDKNLCLKYVNINNNKITFLTKVMIKDFNNLTKLNLKNNPFSCNCRFYWNNEKIMSLIQDQNIFCFKKNVTVNEFFQTVGCTNWILLISLIVFLFFIGVGIIVMFYFRSYLRYKLFLIQYQLRKTSQGQGGGESYVYNNYLYDAFVSYSSDDRNFVIKLINMLEDYPPFIKLCVYERDFDVGAIISENILENISKSRKILLIITDSYIKSQWCIWESQVAGYHNLYLQNQNKTNFNEGLILIKLSPIDETKVSPTLKYLLKMKIYLQWDVDEKKQEFFWKKLRQALAPHNK